MTYDPATQSACPTGYSGPTNLQGVTLPATNETCTCSCGAPEKNPCTQGTGSVSYGYTPPGQPSVCSGNFTKPVSLTIDGTCDAMGMIGKDGANPYSAAKMTALAPVQVACDAPTQFPPALTVAQSRTCVPTAPGIACSGGTCQPSVPSGQQCVMKAGENQQCPITYNIQSYTVVGDPKDIQDQRTCGTCICNSSGTTCSNPTLTTYMGNCGGSGNSVPVDGNCDALSGDDSMDDHFMYTATANNTVCTPTQATVAVTNQVNLNNAFTICCAD